MSPSSQARNKNISNVALKKKKNKKQQMNQPKPNQPTQHATKQIKNPPNS